MRRFTRLQLIAGQARLDTLINHLSTNKFANWNMRWYDTCAASHFPDVFPRHWYRNEFDRPRFRKDGRSGEYDTMASFERIDSFFALPNDACLHNNSMLPLFAGTHSQEECVNRLIEYRDIYYAKALANAS